MGELVDGIWRAEREIKRDDGAFKRDASAFRNWVTPDGAAGPSGADGFAAAAGRYHLYAAYFCPWAHRTLIMRKLKGLEDSISVSIAHWHVETDGVAFAPGDGVIGDPEMNARFLREIYVAAKPDYSGRVTVPVLWDKRRKTIVSNESSEIVRMMNSAFSGARGPDYYPAELREEIDAVNALTYANLNNGVYAAGFATTQGAYEAAATRLFDALDELERRLARADWLVGGRMTEADVRLVVTLLRFDIVYVGHFKCNLRRIADYPALSAYLARLKAIDAIGSTFRPDHVKNHYYRSHPWINPTGIVPIGPAV